MFNFGLSSMGVVFASFPRRILFVLLRRRCFAAASAAATSSRIGGQPVGLGRVIEHAAHPVPAAPELDVVGAVGLPGPPRVLRLDLAAPAGAGGLGRVIEPAARPVPAAPKLDVVGAVGLDGPPRVFRRRAGCKCLRTGQLRQGGPTIGGVGSDR